MAFLSNIRAVLRRYKSRISAFFDTSLGKRVLKGVRYVITASVVGYLFYQIVSIGWEQLWTSLPRTPWFYVIFFAMYLTLPSFQSVIYGLIFRMAPWRIFPASLKKRVYNRDVMSYSGEVYLYFWARKRLSQPGMQILHGIKDNAIISSIASTIIAFGLLALFFFSGLMVLPAAVTEQNITYVLAGGVVFVALIAVGIQFRNSIFQITGSLIASLFGLHVLRLLVVQALQIVQWAVVAPDIPIQTWFTFLAIQIIANSIPFIPSRDLVGVGVAIEIAEAVQVPRALIAGLMLVHSMLDKAFNLLLFVGLSIWEDDPIDVEQQKEKLPPDFRDSA